MVRPPATRARTDRGPCCALPVRLLRCAHSTLVGPIHRVLIVVRSLCARSDAGVVTFFVALLGADLRAAFSCDGDAFRVALVPTKAGAHVLVVQHAGVALSGAPAGVFAIAPGRQRRSGEGRAAGRVRKAGDLASPARGTPWWYARRNRFRRDSLLTMPTIRMQTPWTPRQRPPYGLRATSRQARTSLWWSLPGTRTATRSACMTEALAVARTAGVPRQLHRFACYSDTRSVDRAGELLRAHLGGHHARAGLPFSER